MNHLVLFIHESGSDHQRRTYREALAPIGNVDWAYVNCGALSGSYSSEGQRLRDPSGRVLPRLLAKYLSPSQIAKKYDSLSVISFSAGYALVRELLKHEADRKEIGAYVALDSIHAASIGTAAATEHLRGFAKMAADAAGGQCLFWLGHTDVKTYGYASTTDVAKELKRLVPVGGNWFVRSYDTQDEAHQKSEHAAALTLWGPEFVAEALVPYLGGGWAGTPDPCPQKPPVVSLPEIRFIQARNFTRGRNVPVDLLVIHSMEALEASTTAESVAKWFAGASAPRASAHYCIDDDSIVQCVLESDVAWAAPGANANGIQLELAGYARQTAADWSDEFSTKMLALAAALTADICKRHNIPIEFVDYKGLREKRRGITYHREASKAFLRSTHTDPGTSFPLESFLSMVRAAT